MSKETVVALPQNGRVEADSKRLELLAKMFDEVDILRDNHSSDEIQTDLRRMAKQLLTMSSIVDSARIVVQSEKHYKVDHPGCEVDATELTELECLVREYDESFDVYIADAVRPGVSQ